MASLAEISARAGVSIATTSRVLNGSTHKVSAKTREKVLAVTQELGYTPSLVARTLKTRTRTRIIGMVVGDVSDPYFAEITKGLEDTVAEHGFLTMISSAQRSTRAEIVHLQTLRDYQAAGVVLASSGYENDPLQGEVQEIVDDLMASGCGVFVLAPRDLASSGSFTFDNRAAAFDITNHLIQLGHRRIAFVDGPGGLHTSAHRRAGFEAAMGGHGLDATLRVMGGFEYETGFTAARHLALAPALPDAILAVNDDVAIGLVMGFRQAGVSVPQDVSVAGIDDTKPAQYIGLTTVAAPLRELGRAAGKAIMNGTRGHRVLPHQVVARSTTRQRSR